jgi:hypothetical protein
MLGKSVCHEDISTGWRWVVSLSLRPFFPNGKSSQCELVRRWTPEPIRMWRWREIFLPQTGIEPWLSNPSLITSLAWPSWVPQENRPAVVVSFQYRLTKCSRRCAQIEGPFALYVTSAENKPSADLQFVRVFTLTSIRLTGISSS